MHLCSLQRVAPLINIKSRKTLGGALIGPLIDYGVLVWYRDAPAALKLKLQTAQNKLIRVVLGLPPLTHLTDHHHESVGWLKVADRVQHLAMGLVYKIHYTSKIPMYLTNYFLKVKDVHDHNTRGSSTSHHQRRFNTKQGSNSFSCYTINMWNALPQALKESKSLASFKIGAAL